MASSLYNTSATYPERSVPDMTYNVFSGTLNPTHFTSLIPNGSLAEQAEE